MLDYQTVEKRVMEGLGIERRPVAVSFRHAPPPGVAKFTGTVPSGCTFWKLASAGQTFYTVESDHYNCPIGSYTHNVQLPAARAGELELTLGLMTSIGYVRMEEIPEVFRLPEPPGTVVYAPLGETPADPDVVIVSGRPGRVMLLIEVAMRAGVAAQLPLLGRPTCMALPASLKNGAIASAGCIGNRTYTGIGEDELYVAVPGRDLFRLASAVEAIASANRQLAEYHQSRLPLYQVG